MLVLMDFRIKWVCYVWGSKMKKRKGFTLVELLVVISIIALLMGILMPALSRARMQAQAIVCGSNQKQLGLGWTFYAGDNDDWFPMGVHWRKGLAWWQDKTGIAGYLPTETAFQDESAAVKDNVYKGWYCPTHAKAAIENQQAVGFHFNYNLGFERYTKSSKLKRSSEVPILYCFWDDEPAYEDERPLYLGNYCSAPTDPAQGEDTYRTYHFTQGITGVHNNSTNFLFADGHVERIKDLPDQESYAREFRWKVPAGAVKHDHDNGGW